MQRGFLNHFEAIIASSKELIPEIKNCYQISNGVDTNIFHEISSEEKHHLKIKLNIEGKITFLCARRWAPTKGIVHLAKALNLLDEKVQKKIVVLFAGNDSEDFYKYKAIVQSELDKCSNIDIRYFGNIKHKKLAELINSSDVGIIPSIMEGISLFSIELVSCGIPVLGTNVGGIPEIVQNNVKGWIVPLKSPASLAKQMTYIVQNWPNSSLKINTEEIRKTHSWTSITKEIVNIYETKK
uniref:glycosyltransferase family 4 protein n=1 Tax=Flavobacterium sp. TaxID=239 RepID=UPI00404B93A8